MLYPVNILPIVLRTVCPVEFAITMEISIFPLSFVRLAITVVHSSSAFGKECLRVELTLIRSAVNIVDPRLKLWLINDFGCELSVPGFWVVYREIAFNRSALI